MIDRDSLIRRQPLQTRLDWSELSVLAGLTTEQEQAPASEGNRVWLCRVGAGLLAAYAPSCRAKRLFWFLTQPGIRNASTRTQTTVINIPTMVRVRMSCATATPVRLR